MKYATKIPPTDNELYYELMLNGWKKIKEPKKLKFAIIYSIPFMILNSIIFLLILNMLNNPSIETFYQSLLTDSGFTFTITINLLFISIEFIFLYIHEICHAIFIPNFIKSEKTFLGITLFGGFVSTTEKIKKERYLLISFAPFIALSVIFPIILNSIGLLNGTMVIVCLLNAMGSSVDFFYALIILLQVPRGAYIINNGYETYFKI
jgi:hypothetical protein